MGRRVLVGRTGRVGGRGTGVKVGTTLPRVLVGCGVGTAATATRVGVASAGPPAMLGSPSPLVIWYTVLGTNRIAANTTIANKMAMMTRAMTILKIVAKQPPPRIVPSPDYCVPGSVYRTISALAHSWASQLSKRSCNKTARASAVSGRWGSISMSCTR